MSRKVIMQRSYGLSLSLSLAHIESLLEKLVLSLSRRTEKSSSTKPPKENHRALGESENIKKRSYLPGMQRARHG
jgi:hypothetical protein